MKVAELIKSMENEITKQVTNCVDRQALLIAIESSTIKCDAVLRYGTALGNLHTTLRVHGHCYIEENAKADELTRLGSQSRDL